MDVISWDVSALQSELVSFEQEMREQMKVTEALEIVDDVLSVIDIGMAIPGVVKFVKESKAGQRFMRFFDRTTVEEVANVTHEMEDLTRETVDTMDSIVEDIRDFDIRLLTQKSQNINWDYSMKVFNKIIDWANSETKTMEFTGEYRINPTTCLLTLSAAFQTALKVRDTLKPALLEITNNIIDIHDTMADENYRITENDFIKNELETPEVINEIGRVKFTFKNKLLDGEFTFRAIWQDSPTDWDDVTLKFKHNIDADTHKLIDGFKVVSYSTKYDVNINRFQQPVINSNEIIIDPVPHPEDPTPGIDEFADVQILSSNIRTYIDDTPAFRDLVYKDELKNYVPLADYQALLARVEALEGKHSLETNNELIEQIKVLEAKCANIESALMSDSSEVRTVEQRVEILESKLMNVYNDMETNEPLTLKQRVDVLTHKCANIAI